MEMSFWSELFSGLAFPIFIFCLVIWEKLKGKKDEKKELQEIGDILFWK